MRLSIMQSREKTLVRIPFLFMTSLIFIASVNHCVTKPDNQPPTAVFSVTPESGTVETEFIFDASESSDPEEESKYLQVRWDWEGDGEWDTLWSSKKTRAHRFERSGTIHVSLAVRDSWGSVASTGRDIIIGIATIACYSPR